MTFRGCITHKNQSSLSDCKVQFNLYVHLFSDLKRNKIASAHSRTAISLRCYRFVILYPCYFVFGSKCLSIRKLIWLTPVFWWELEFDGKRRNKTKTERFPKQRCFRACFYQNTWEWLVFCRVCAVHALSEAMHFVEKIMTSILYSCIDRLFIYECPIMINVWCFP